MRRRRLIAGFSAVLGASAALGSGAFTNVEANRTVEVRVATDSNSYLGLYPTDSPFSSMENGQLTLDFSEITPENGPGAGTFDNGKGLNPGSTYWFDDLFDIVNQGPGGDVRVVVTRSGFEVEDLAVETAEGGQSLLATDYDDPVNVPKLVEPDSLTVNLRIETGEETNTTAGGTFSIHAARGSNYGDDPFRSVVEDS